MDSKPLKLFHSFALPVLPTISINSGISEMKLYKEIRNLVVLQFRYPKTTFSGQFPWDKILTLKILLGPFFVKISENTEFVLILKKTNVNDRWKYIFFFSSKIGQIQRSIVQVSILIFKVPMYLNFITNLHLCKGFQKIGK